MGENLAAYLAIVAMALVTYATRVLGPVLTRVLPDSPRLDAALAAVPGAVLVAIVVPAVLAAGEPGLVATVVVVLVTARTQKPLLGATAGVVVVWATTRAGW
ncbi:MAG: AzlD domain-containing protein [Thermomicrobiales bacterium]